MTDSKKLIECINLHCIQWLVYYGIELFGIMCAFITDNTSVVCDLNTNTSTSFVVLCGPQKL